MKVVIVEDEIAASDNLAYLLEKLEPGVQVLAVLDSVQAAVAYFSSHSDMDLVFLDIHLADGLSFEIFEKTRIQAPIIFTTAYDQYALKAFKVNSIDYLLKPIDREELAQSLEQFKEQRKPEGIGETQVSGLLELLQRKSPAYKTTFLASQKDGIQPVRTDRIAYFFIDTGVVKCVTFDRQTYVLDNKLEEIEDEVDPRIFYRVNRQYILHRDTIANIKFYFNGKLIVSTEPASEERIVVSKAKASEFKEWVGS